MASNTRHGARVLCLMVGAVVLFAFLGQSALAAETGDVDADGIPDRWEQDVFHTNAQKSDSDNDGFNDLTEILYGFHPNGKGALKEADSDVDGLTDAQEMRLGSDPTVADSDGDGFTDGKEVWSGHSPTSTSPEPMERQIRITLKKQELAQVFGGTIFATYKVSTGKPGMRTPTGEFHVLSKSKRAWSKSAGLWMPWWMQFTKRGNGIHELPEWPSGKKEGANHLGKPVSHGCVRLGIGPAKQLYDWVPIGTRITITN